MFAIKVFLRSNKLSQQVEIGMLGRFGNLGFGFIEIPSRDVTPQRLYCHFSNFRRPEARGEKVIFRTPEEIDPAGTLVRQLEELASQRTPVAFVLGRNGRGPEASLWCVATTLATAEYEVIAYLTAEARERQTKLADLRREFEATTRESDELLRLSPVSVEDALARGWTIRQDQGKQVVMVTTGPSGKLISRTFSTKKGAGFSTGLGLRLRVG